MKRGYGIVLAASTAIVLVTSGLPSLGASGLTQQDIERALRPVPPALQGGHQGLPTIGVPVRPEPDRNYTRASTSAPASVPDSGSVRPAPRREQVRAVAPAPAQACPPQVDVKGKPMIDFKVEFEFGSAQLKPESIQTLTLLGKALNEGLRDQKTFRIEGHTDAVGSLPYNERLSEERAAAVREFLVRTMGVSPDRLSSVGRAFCEPLNPANPYGAENRRVVVINQTS